MDRIELTTPPRATALAVFSSSAIRKARSNRVGSFQDDVDRSTSSSGLGGNESFKKTFSHRRQLRCRESNHLSRKRPRAAGVAAAHRFRNRRIRKSKRRGRNRTREQRHDRKCRTSPCKSLDTGRKTFSTQSAIRFSSLPDVPFPESIL